MAGAFLIKGLCACFEENILERKNMHPDFSKEFQSNQYRIKTGQYCGKICARCGGMCCAFNTSPISNQFSLPINFEDDNVIVGKKMFHLHEDFRKKFVDNMKKLMAHFEKKGFGKGLVKDLEKSGFDYETCMKILWVIEGEITRYNYKVYEKDPYNDEGKIYNDCLFLIPGQGCIMEQYRPFTCITAFRKCFPSLDLFNFTLGNVHKITENRLYEYVKANLKINSQGFVPALIIGAPPQLQNALAELFIEVKTSQIDELSIHQLALLADFITYPFRKLHKSLNKALNKEEFYIAKRIKDPPPFTFINRIYEGEKSFDFSFGMDYVQCFEVI